MMISVQRRLHSSQYRDTSNIETRQIILKDSDAFVVNFLHKLASVND